MGGDGKQSVFLREADYVNKLLTTRFGALWPDPLVNHRDHLADRPTGHPREPAPRRANARQRSGPEDLLFIYLTSHGTAEHELVLDQPRWNWPTCPPTRLAAVLAPLKNRDKIIVISACYSGGFIPALKDERTLIITASREDRVSFGCSEEADFTYFGDALFAKALIADRRSGARLQYWPKPPSPSVRLDGQFRSLGAANLGAEKRGHIGSCCANSQAESALHSAALNAAVDAEPLGAGLLANAFVQALQG